MMVRYTSPTAPDDDPVLKGGQGGFKLRGEEEGYGAIAALTSATRLTPAEENSSRTKVGVRSLHSHGGNEIPRKPGTVSVE